MTQTLNISDVTLLYDQQMALNHVSLSCGVGDVVGIMGPNGAGKTTFLNVMSGNIPLQTGDVSINGVSLSKKPSSDFARAGIARTFQHPRLFSNLNFYDNIFCAGLPHYDVDKSHDITKNLLKKFNLIPFQDDFPTGKDIFLLKSLELARCLAIHPQFLLLDELMSGLNHSEIAFFNDILRAFLKSNTTSIIFIEHNFEYLKTLASQTVIMNEGQIIKRLDQKSIQAYDNVHDLYQHLHVG